MGRPIPPPPEYDSWDDVSNEDEIRILRAHLESEQGTRGDLVTIALSLLGFCTILVMIFTFITVTQPDADMEFLSFIAGIAIANLPRIISAIGAKYTGTIDIE